MMLPRCPIVSVIDAVFYLVDGELRISELPALGKTEIAAIQTRVSRRVLRWFVRWGLLDPDDARAMREWHNDGGFSLDAAVRIPACAKAQKGTLPFFLEGPNGFNSVPFLSRSHASARVDASGALQTFCGDGCGAQELILDVAGQNITDAQLPAQTGDFDDRAGFLAPFWPHRFEQALLAILPSLRTTKAMVGSIGRPPGNDPRGRSGRYQSGTGRRMKPSRRT